MKEKMYQVVIGVSWSVPATSAEEAVAKGKAAVSEKGYAYIPEACSAVEEKSILEITPGPEQMKERIGKYIELVQSLQKPEGEINYRKVSAMFGPKYARIVVAGGNQRSVHSFINLSSGDVLKPKGWAGPELKNPRSNIFAGDFGASGITEYGTNYLK